MNSGYLAALLPDARILVFDHKALVVGGGHGVATVFFCGIFSKDSDVQPMDLGDTADRCIDRAIFSHTLDVWMPTSTMAHMDSGSAQSLVHFYTSGTGRFYLFRDFSVGHHG